MLRIPQQSMNEYDPQLEKEYTMQFFPSAYPVFSLEDQCEVEEDPYGLKEFFDEGAILGSNYGAATGYAGVEDPNQGMEPMEESAEKTSEPGGLVMVGLAQVAAASAQQRNYARRRVMIEPRCEIVYIPFEGRIDRVSFEIMLSKVNPKKLIIVNASARKYERIFDYVQDHGLNS